MNIVKLCIENIEIKRYLVKKVYGIYVYGDKTKAELPQEFMKELRNKRGQEILNEHYKRDLWGLPPNVNRKIELRLELRKPGENWYGQCPYSTKKDVPFDDGCKIYTYGGSLGKIGEFTFFLIGKDNCKKLEECAIYLGEKIGMKSEINYFKGGCKTRAETEIEHVIKHNS